MIFKDKQKTKYVIDIKLLKTQYNTFFIVLIETTKLLPTDGRAI